MNKCDNCGGKISFEPKSKGNRCENCDSIFPIEYIYNFNKKPFSQDIEVKVDNFAQNTKSLKCASCGAIMILNKLETQSNCPYCGNTSINESRKNKLMYIDSIVPFAFSYQEALKTFKTTLNARFYTNKKVFKCITNENINGIYVNAFVFDMATSSTYSGVFSYSVTVKDKDGNMKTEIRHKTVHGTHGQMFNNLTIEANSHINQQDLHGIMPFDFKSAVDFKEDFMNGYLLEYENKMFDDCVKTAEALIKKQIENELLRKHKCDRIVTLNLNTNYIERNYNYCLLPVYLISNVYKDKKYTALINGQTGKVGDLPVSVGKILLTVFLCLGIVGVIILLVLLCV